ncbi:alkaline ceramidase 2-like [Saccoglossus kowalevskii]|uniref:Alkaline ceramidase n=1 Tax=Saccoglossus kowalevskii TaxID=10224 RepID=A0ABM0GT86_SACKO|nr:PREDICTED: alkaline ceramidase 2-like [Saccoglossus kowalevskii]
MFIPVELQRGSSEIDWCEHNYAILPGIAEFFNTISNVLFFLLPPMLIHLFRQYAQQVNKGINIIWILLVVVGVCSAYFHATLSLVGQLLDELAILWVIMWSTAMFFPRRYYPAIFNGNRTIFKVAVVTLSIFSTVLAFLHPAVNHLVMICFVLPSAFLLVTEMRRCDCDRVYRLGRLCGIYTTIAVTVWMSDQVNCNFWSALKFPYLHSIWHIMIFEGAYLGCVLFAYFDAVVEVPEQGPMLKYWPDDTWELVGVPYISFKTVAGKATNC